MFVVSVLVVLRGPACVVLSVNSMRRSPTPRASVEGSDSVEIRGIPYPELGT